MFGKGPKMQQRTLTNRRNNSEKSIYQFWQIHVTTQRNPCIGSFCSLFHKVAPAVRTLWLFLGIELLSPSGLFLTNSFTRTCPPFVRSISLYNFMTNMERGRLLWLAWEKGSTQEWFLKSCVRGLWRLFKESKSIFKSSSNCGETLNSLTHV